MILGFLLILAHREQTLGRREKTVIKLRSNFEIETWSEHKLHLDFLMMKVCIRSNKFMHEVFKIITWIPSACYGCDTLVQYPVCHHNS